MLVKAFFILAALLGITHCEDPTRCCMPNQWSANIVQTIGDYNTDSDAAFLAYGNADVYYDHTGNQLAYRQKLDNQTAHVKTVTWGIVQYKNFKKYEIRDGKCTVTQILDKMYPPCIPDNATFFGTHNYPAGVKVDFWHIPGDPNRNVYRRVGVTHDSCMPLTMTHLTTGPDYVLGMHLFQNVTKGISDPSVFVVPSICNPPVKHNHVNTWLKVRTADRSGVVSMEQDNV